MHNWRLLLLALVAVLQPIASFTERNFIDGRQECCDTKPHYLRDSRRTLHGTYRYSKTLPEERRLGHREIREDRRHESRQETSVLTRPARERSLQERAISRISPELTIHSSRTDRQTDQTRDIRASNRDGHRRIVNERFSTDSSIRKYDHDTLQSTRVQTSRGESRPTHLGTKQLSRYSIDSRRETRRTDNSEQLARTRETMDVLRRTKTLALSRKDIRRNTREESRERAVQQRVSSFRLETRPQIEIYRDRRSLDRRARDIVGDYRRAISADARINERDSDIRQEKRLSFRQNKDDRQNSRERLVTERIDERRQQRSRDSTVSVRRESRDRTSTERKLDTRESTTRMVARQNNERHSRVYREYRKAVRVESKRVMERELGYNRDTGVNRRARAVNRRNTRDHRSAEQLSARDVSRIGVEYATIRLNNVKNEAIESRYKNRELARSRNNLDFTIQEKTMSEDQTFIANWQFVFYTLQGIYLFSLIIQMLYEKESARRKTRNFNCWPLFTGNLIKMD